jgi:S-adenosylmethionine hydrolase
MTRPSGIVTLLSDFGLADAYAGALRGSVLAANPAARVVDITHDVPPQDIVLGALVLEQAWPYFPPGSVHVAVVDPGVGTARRRLALAAAGHLFVGPDNGVLSAALPDEARGRRPPGEGYAVREVVAPAGVTVVAIEEASLLPREPSATFEGRDVFGPVAGRLSGGLAIERVGRLAGRLLALPAFRAPATPEGLDGLVMRIDRFGSLVTDVRERDLPRRPIFLIRGARVEGLTRTYGEASGLCALVGSSGFVEVAVPGGSAAGVLGAAAGERVAVRSR